ncbi:hypothetical protein BRD56_04590 [Thermoplasmatales archaeon SW_10_69_26]|nr:MAG: hypothetical protein BRD56_04590 [Thermoplasmatales archaeon SW_10_69_26]
MHRLGTKLDNLRDVLSEKDRPLGFLLGAGCPQAVRQDGEPVIPPTPDLTRGAINTIQDVPELEPALTAVLELLDWGEGVISEDEAEAGNPDLEELLETLRLLQSLPPGSALEAISHDDLSALERLLSSEITEELDAAEFPDQQTPYHDLAAWVRDARRTYPASIFTTNYDLLIEEALEDERVPYFTGFTGTEQAFLDDTSLDFNALPTNWARLWKLHGSINWAEIDGEIYRTSVNHQNSGVIHPSERKYDQSKRQPYQVMFDRLESFLRAKGAILVICGYSFGDEHINSLLRRALQNNENANAFGLLFNSLDEYPGAKNLATDVSNFNLLAPEHGVFGSQVEAWDDTENGDLEIRIGASPDDGPTCTLGDFEKLGGFLSDIANNGGQQGDN